MWNVLTPRPIPRPQGHLMFAVHHFIRSNSQLSLHIWKLSQQIYEYGHWWALATARLKLGWCYHSHHIALIAQLPNNQNTNRSTIKISTAIKSKHKLPHNQNTNRSTIKISTAIKSKHQLPNNQNTNCPTIKISTAQQSKHKLRHDQNINRLTIKTPTAPQSKHQPPHNLNTNCPTIKTSNIWKENGGNITEMRRRSVSKKFMNVSENLLPLSAMYKWQQCTSDSNVQVAAMYKWHAMYKWQQCTSDTLCRGVSMRLKALTTMVTKNAVFWNVTSPSWRQYLFPETQNISTELHGAIPHQSVRHTQLTEP